MRELQQRWTMFFRSASGGRRKRRIKREIARGEATWLHSLRPFLRLLMQPIPHVYIFPLQCPIAVRVLINLHGSDRQKKKKTAQINPPKFFPHSPGNLPLVLVVFLMPRIKHSLIKSSHRLKVMSIRDRDSTLYLLLPCPITAITLSIIWYRRKPAMHGISGSRALHSTMQSSRSVSPSSNSVEPQRSCEWAEPCTAIIPAHNRRLGPRWTKWDALCARDWQQIGISSLKPQKSEDGVSPTFVFLLHLFPSWRMACDSWEDFRRQFNRVSMWGNCTVACYNL